MAEPFFFRPEGQALFGVYHTPETRADRDVGVVIAPPYGIEHMKTHRALRQLAIRLSKGGFHVLRFDFRSCGDSAGEPADADLDGWVDDLAAAIEEIKDRAGVARVALVGLRLGGTAALLAAARRRDVEAVVLWEPILDGPAYVNELVTLATSWQRANRFDPPAAAEPTRDVLGFPLTDQLRLSLEALSLPSAGRPARKVLVLIEVPRSDAAALVAGLGARGAKAEMLEAPSSRVWITDRGVGRPISPHTTLQAVVEWLGRECA